MHATPPIPHPANLRPQLYEFDLYRPLLFDHLCGNEESFYRSYFFKRKISTSSFIKVYIYDLLQIAAFFLFFSLLVPHPPLSKVDHYGSLVHIYSNRNSFCPWVFAIRGQVNLKVPTGHWLTVNQFTYTLLKNKVKIFTLLVTTLNVPAWFSVFTHYSFDCGCSCWLCDNLNSDTNLPKSLM